MLFFIYLFMQEEGKKKKKIRPEQTIWKVLHIFKFATKISWAGNCTKNIITCFIIFKVLKVLRTIL